jgi:AraC-like DNA-binding protein
MVPCFIHTESGGFFQTPVEYLLHYRIQKSLSLLTHGNLTITDIAAACGFNGASYYTEVFRKIMGISPSAYRKSR